MGYVLVGDSALADPFKFDDPAQGRGKSEGGNANKKAPPSAERATSLTFPQLEKQLTVLIAFPGVLLTARGDQVCGKAFLEGAENEAKALVNLAKQQPSIRRVLELLVTGGAWGEVAMATAAIAIPVMRHHNVPIPFLDKKPEKQDAPTEKPKDVEAPITADFIVPEEPTTTNGKIGPVRAQGHHAG